MRTVTTKPASVIDSGATHYRFEPPLDATEKDALTAYLKKLGHDVISVDERRDVSTLYLIRSGSGGTTPFFAIERMFDPFDDGLIEWNWDYNY